MTGKTIIFPTFNTVASNDNKKTGLLVTPVRGSDDKELSLSVRVYEKGAQCIDRNSKVYVLFTDKTKVILYNKNDFNCDGQIFLIFSELFNNEAELENFKTKTIEAMRTETQNGYVERDFTVASAEKLRDQLICLSK